MKDRVLCFFIPESEEQKMLYDVLRHLKINDIEITVDGDDIIANDYDGNRWENEELYEFLIDDAFVWEDDGTVLGISDELLRRFMDYAKYRGIT